MTITISYQNVPATTAESINIKPFTRNAWVKTGGPVEKSGALTVEHSVLGDNAQYPLMRTVEVRNASLFHPAQKKNVVDGRRYIATIHTTVSTSDSVTGLVTYTPVQLQVSIAVGGATIPVPADALSLLLSTCSELWDSVTAGVPDAVAMSKLALGAVEI